MTAKEPIDAERFRRLIALADRVAVEGPPALEGADPLDAREVAAMLADTPQPEPRLAMRAPIDHLIRDLVECIRDDADDPAVRQAGDASPDSQASRTKSDLKPTPKPNPTSPKPAIAGYEIVQLLGVGGHAEVWEAIDTRHGRRRVAIKVLMSPSVSRRFALERDLIGRLSHPGIATIHEQAVTSDGRLCMVMELVEGDAFTRACTVHALSVRRRVELIVEVCRAVEHAHAHGVIHRDLKPANILVCYRPTDAGALGLQAKVIDFGVAKALERADWRGEHPSRTHHPSPPDGAFDSLPETMPGQLIGTIAYMSPEQRSGTTRLTTVAVDIYALGTVLYEALAGAPRWSIADMSIVQALDTMARSEPVPLDRAAPHLPRDLVAVVERSVAARPEDRYPSMRDFADDLDRWLAGEPVSARQPGIVQRTRWLVRRYPKVASAAAASFVLAGLAIGLATHRSIEQTRLGIELATWCENSVALINDVAATPGSLEGRDRLSAFVIGQIDHLVELVNATGGIPRSRLDDIVAESSIARSAVLRQKGEIDEAGALRRRAMAVREAALAREPSDDARRDLAYATILVGDIHRERGDERGALGLYESAHAIYVELVGRSDDAFDDSVQLLWSHDRLCDVALSQAAHAIAGGDAAAHARWLGRAAEHAGAMESTLAAMRAASAAQAAGDGSATGAQTLGSVLQPIVGQDRARMTVGEEVEAGGSHAADADRRGQQSPQPIDSRGVFRQSLARLLHAEVATRSRLLATMPADRTVEELAELHRTTVALAEELCAVAPDNVVFLQQLTGRLGAAANFEWTRGDLAAALRHYDRQRVALQQALDREPGDLDTRCRLAECCAAISAMSVSAGRFEDAERWITLGRETATLLVQLQPENPAYRGVHESFGHIEQALRNRRDEASGS
jgi:serine/threonine protein kinase